MYIEPNTNIKILRNVPLENTYDHTLYFANASEQYTYFASMLYKNCTNYIYQRVNKGKMRIEGKADNYYNCNYLMFQNTNFGTKWFYAFITSVEYVNNETTEITFEIDVIQTWLFDAHVEECFVERQHSLSDAIGDNIVPETLDCGEYIFNDYEPLLHYTDPQSGFIYTMGNKMLVVIAIVDVDHNSDGKVYDGVYGSASLYAYDTDDVQGINAKIDEYRQKPEAIISMYMMPKIFLPTLGDVPDEPHKIPAHSDGWKQVVRPIPVNKNMTLDGYTPKNGKMYTYPYNFYNVDNSNGQSLALRYEFFHDLHPEVEVNCTITQPVVATCRPTGYKGLPAYDPLAGTTSLNTETIQISNFPMCSWNVDAYQAWIAQNSIPIVLNTVAQGAQTGIAATYSAHPKGTIAAGAVGITANLLSEFYTASIQADISKGNFNNGGVNSACGKQQFYGGRCSVSYQYAKMIDDYFTMYGYAVKSIARLNTHGRPHWNYVKTVGCVLSGSVPSDDTKKITSIYDRGITFWRHANEVGNYSLDNSLNNE